jgi:hypothetical protein
MLDNLEAIGRQQNNARKRGRVMSPVDESAGEISPAKDQLKGSPFYQHGETETALETGHIPEKQDGIKPLLVQVSLAPV